jgi:murein DD-endopeptidase MepM/ murein hydrolase activator NlpD
VLHTLSFLKLHRIPLGLVAAALVVGVVAPRPPAGAQTEPNPKSKSELSEAIDNASADEAAAVTELQGVVAQRQELEAEVAALERQVADATRRVQAAEAEIARVQTEIDTVQRNIDQIKAEIQASKDRFNQSAVALYKSNGALSSTLSILSTSGGVHDIVAGSKYLGDRSRQFERELQRQGSLKDQLDDAQHDLKAEQAKSQQAQAAAAQERDQATQLRSEADAQRDQVARAESREQSVLDGIRARKADFEAQYNALQAQIAASLSTGNPTPGNHRFIWPVNGPITSPFGYRNDPVLGGNRLHSGVDIGASMGTPIKAAGDGVVVMAGWNGGYGNWTLIDHGNGLATGYGHQSSIAVHVGERVSQGQIIGNVGSTGASTGPHLHWEVRVNGTPVDPMGWV